MEKDKIQKYCNDEDEGSWLVMLLCLPGTFAIFILTIVIVVSIITSSLS